MYSDLHAGYVAGMLVPSSMDRRINVLTIEIRSFLFDRM
jgi:hypothetical protein